MLQLFCLGAPQLTLSTTAFQPTLTQKALALFVYLAVTQQAHSRDTLADLLWSETNNQQARNNLRYLLPDLRRVVGDYLTITAQTIGFNRQAPYQLDVEILQNTLVARTPATPIQALQAALDLYQDEFLAGFPVRNVPVFEEWVVQQRAGLHALAVQGFYTLAERYHQTGDFPAALATTQRLMQWEPLHEAGHRLHMHLLVAVGQRTAALTQHRLFQQTLADELGVEPEAATVTLYEQIRSGAYDKVTGDKATGDKATGDKVTGDKATGDKATGDKATGDKATGDKVTSASSVTLSPVTPSPLPPVALAPKHNLPGQLTPFFGRETEIAQIGAYLADARCRLLTLVGEGGVGKTRLALAVAQRILDFGFWIVDSKPRYGENPKSKAQNPTFPDGIWFVALSGIVATDSLMEPLAAAVANVMGLHFSGNQPLLTQLLTQIHHKSLCLLFDNAEHLLPIIADFLLQLLQGSPQTTVVVTSRHLLNVQAEFVWRVSGLSVPIHEPGAPLLPARRLDYSSIALFVERAKRNNRTFQVTTENGATIAAICRLVEGLPLAIELAAALTKQYTCTELYATLQQDYTILATSLRDLSPRHRSIQAMLDHSWRFLTPDAANTLAACACFAGGFTLDAAMAVTGATPPLLHQLVDQSLLQLRAGRFTMHELVRQYAAAQLAQTPTHDRATAARHAAYYSVQLQALADALIIDPLASDIFRCELENLRLAWHWSVVQGDLALLTCGLEGIARGCYLTGLYSEALHLLEAALTAVRQVIDIASDNRQSYTLLAHLLCQTSQFYRRISKVDSSEQLATEALTLGQQLNDPTLQGTAYCELARLMQHRGDFKSMLTLAESACDQARRGQPSFLLADCLNALGVAAGITIGPRAAVPHFHEALALLRKMPHRPVEASVISNLGFYSLIAHDYQTAYLFLQQAIDLHQQFSNQEGKAIARLHLSDLWMALGLYDKAQQEYAHALPSIQIIHLPYWESWLHISHGRLRHLQGDLAGADQAYGVAHQLAKTNRLELQKLWTLVHQAHVVADLGDYTVAHHAYEQTIALPKQVNWAYRTADAHAGLAALLLQTNAIAEAVTHAEAALAFLTQMGLAGANEPFTVYWTAVRVFTAAGDPRATDLLRTAYRHLQAIAGKLEDATLHRSFLENVVVNRDLLAAAQKAGIS